MKKLFTIAGWWCMATCLQAQVSAPEKRFAATAISYAEQAAQQRYRLAMKAGLSVASANFDVNFYRCEWDIDPAVRYIKGSVTSYFTITTATTSIIYDLHTALKVDSVRFRNKKTGFQQTADNGLTIQLPETLAAFQKDSVTVFYQGVPVSEGFGAFVTTSQNGTPVMWTLSEPYGAKNWWPCKNAAADKADSIDIVVTYPARYASSSNGLLVQQATANGKKTDYWKHRYPIATYLVAMAITNYTVTNDSVPIGNVLLPVCAYTYAANTGYFNNATVIAKLCLQKFSELFGPYPFMRESYSQTQFGVGGGMEHQTNSFLGDNYNHLVAHELGHQWFGDKVTCNSWQDIWLNEGFATYMQAIYVENFEPSNLIPLVNAVRDIVVGSPGGSLKVNDTDNVQRIFDNRLTYNKGFSVLHMIRWKLGDALFFKAMRQYLNDPLIAYGTARTGDLKRNLEQVSGQDFTRFFKEWYEGEGYPGYQVQWTSDNNRITVKIGQTTSHPSVAFYEMPVPIAFKANGKDTIVVFNHTGNGQRFVLDLGFHPDTAIFDPFIRLLSAGNTVTKVQGIIGNPNDIKMVADQARGRLMITVQNPTGKRLRIQLLNMAGQQVYKKEIALSGTDEQIDIPLASLATGIYITVVTGDDFRMVKKIYK